MGPRAVLIEALAAGPADWAAGLRAMALPGVIDVVPAAETVLVTCSGATELAAVRERLAGVDDARVDALPRPGETWQVEARIERRLGRLTRVEARFFAGGREAGRATLVLTV